jgi:uncharacterized Zn finger protein (UPF0148 family)
MLNEPAQLDLFRKLQEATTDDVDEERGSFKKGDKVVYHMLGGILDNSDLIRTLGVDEHAVRVNHNETIAEIVEAIGEEVSRYSIMFEDGFVINDVAVSELRIVEEKSPEFSSFFLAECPRCGEKFKVYSEGDIECPECGWRPEVQESKTNEAEDATQTMKPQEKPNINAEDLHMEDYSEDDLEKAKSKSAETGNAIRQVDDKELVIKPDKVVTPKKESKVNEEDTDKKFGVFGNHRDTNEYHSSYYDSAEDAIAAAKELAATYYVEAWAADEKGHFDNLNQIIWKSKPIVKEETEITPSRAEFKRIGDEQLKRLHKNTCGTLEYWKRDGTSPEKVSALEKAVGRYEEELLNRGLMSKAGEATATSEKKESKFSFIKKQEPLWLCSECYKTFRSSKSICTLCESKKVEKIVEQDVGFTKEVFKVTWRNTDTEKEESTNVTGIDKADVRVQFGKKPNKELIKIEGPITEEPKGGSTVPFDSGSEGSKLYETVRELIGEVSGISKDEQNTLIQAIEKGDISNTWPSDETMIDKLSASETASRIMSVEDIDGLDMGEIRFAYLKYILLPKAKETAEVASESKLSEQEVEGVPEKGQTYHITQKLGMGLPEGTYEITDVSYRWTTKGDLAKHFQVAGDDRWWAVKFYGFKSAAESGVEETKKFEPITAVEIARSEVDPDAYNIRVVELPEGSIVILDSVSDKEEAIKRGKEFARNLNAKFLGIIDEKKVEQDIDSKELKLSVCKSKISQDMYHKSYADLTSEEAEIVDRELNKKESKLKEQQLDMTKLGDDELVAKYEEQLHKLDWTKETGAGEVWGSDLYQKVASMTKEIKRRGLEIGESKLKEQEEDTFKTVAKGIEDRDTADRLAAEKEGQVVQDEEDDKKFAVITKER